MSVPKLDKLPEPKNLGALKAEVERRWGTIDLLDIQKDTAFITGFTESFTSVASREVLDHATLNRRLLLVLFALGTNMTSRRWPSPASTASAKPSSGYGVMIYWHVERGRLCIYSQLKSCSSSEVAAMIEGLLRHGTEAEIEANYIDTHGASLVRVCRAARLQAPAPAEEHRRDPALRPRRRPDRVAAAGEDPQEAAHRLGPHRPQLSHYPELLCPWP